MPQIKYVGTADEVEVDGLGVVKHGEVVDCPAYLANGVKPTEPETITVGEGKDAVEVPNPAWHPGTSGLLAQPDNWQAVKATKKGGE